MPLALTITDNEDGTGGIATVSGSAVGSTNTLYSASFTGAEGSLSWTTGNNRVGDGTIATALQGAYLFQVRSALSGATEVSPLVYSWLTNAAEQALHYRILQAVYTRVNALALSGLTLASSQVKWLPRYIKGVDTVPCAMISPVDRESYPGILTGQDDIELAVGVFIIDKQKKDFTANLNRNLGWRWDIISALRFQRLAGVPEVLQCVPEPTPVVDEGMFDEEIFFSPIVFKFLTRTTRG